MIIDLFLNQKITHLRSTHAEKENTIVIVFGLPIHFHHDFKICDFYNVPQKHSLYLIFIIQIKTVIYQSIDNSRLI